MAFCLQECPVAHLDDLTPDSLPHLAGQVQAGVGLIHGIALRAGEVEIPCAGVFILRPSLAPADLLPGLALEGNYIAVDRNMATNVPGVFAAGDCTGLPLQVSKAVGEGLVAGHRAAEYLDKTAK